MILEALIFIVFLVIFVIVSMLFLHLALFLLKEQPIFKESIIFSGVIGLGMIINFFFNNIFVAVLTFIAGYVAILKTYEFSMKESTIIYVIWLLLWFVLGFIISLF